MQRMQDATFKALLRGKGEKARLARALGVDKATVTRWTQHRVPAESVLEVEKATGIPRTTIRPDIYPNDPCAASPEPSEAAQ